MHEFDAPSPSPENIRVFLETYSPIDHGLEDIDLADDRDGERLRPTKYMAQLVRA